MIMRQAAIRLEHYHIPLATNQIRYNLLNRQPEENGLLDACRELDVALVAYRPLEWRVLKSNNVPEASPSSSPSSKGEQALQEILRRIAHQHGKSVSQVTLNWLLRRDEHAIPIPGAASDRHALENADRLTWELSDDEFRAIDQAFSPWKGYTGRERHKLIKDMIRFGVKRWFGGRS
jgi:aryl-alcohol dehydrogenase-like predicted oxidoreductase